MSDKPQQATDYSNTHTELAERVLLEVWSKLGEFHKYLVLIGGLTPRYLIPQRSLAPAELHCGTLDVDLGVSVVVANLEAYESIRRVLTKHLAFRPARNRAGREQRHSFVKLISGMDVSIDFLTTDYDGPEDALIRQVQKNLSAIQVEGLGLALENPLEVKIEGELLSGGRTVETVNVCRPVPFMVLKALAFQKRREPKDAYDLVYVLRHYREGPASVAAEITSGQRQQVSFQHAIETLRLHFQSTAFDGPVKYGQFVASPVAGTVAYAAVQEFLANL